MKPVADPGTPPPDRPERILDAAEVCFVRSGFDRTTMQDLAREAAMSPANLYRYFDSKEALVVGLVAREHRRGRALVERLGRSGDERATLLGVIDEYFGRVPRRHAILRLDIWAEATRNPAIAALVARTEEESRLWFMGALSRLGVSVESDPATLYAKLAAMMKGIVISRAILPDYDPTPMIAHLRAVLAAGLAGSVPGDPQMDA